MEVSESLNMVPAGDVLIWLAQEYEKQQLYSDLQKCLDAAISTLLDRLLSRALVAWANEIFIDTENPEVGFSYDKILNPADILTQTKFGPVPLDFWCQFSNATSHFRSVCTVTGDFKFGFDSGSYPGWRQGRAYRVVFEQPGLLALGYPGIIAKTHTTTQSIGAAEAECRNWLKSEILSDTKQIRSKASFREEALEKFKNRLTARGFNDRVWPTVASELGRSKPGAKKKSSR